MAQVLRTVGRYEILSELGRGSMGVVYRAHDPTIGRTVAIKMLLTERMAAGDLTEYLARFHREAQSAGALAHPNIVTIYDFGEDNGNYYLAMEFLEGKSLERLVQEQPLLPVETIMPIFDQVCSALDVAHAHGIVHRDVKPANIMILESGQVKVTDFGIAKVMAAEMTQAGQVLGTPNYMSPEQVLNRPLDGRSDLFSLGAILYELVTGEKPFIGQNITTVIYKIIHEMPIPPRELDPGIHPGLSYVIGKALAKSPDERYQTCSELASDLKNYKNIEGVVATGATMVMKAPVRAPAEVSEVEGGAPERGGAAVAAPVEVQPEAAPVAAAPVSRVRRGLHLPLLLSALIVLGAAAAYYFLFFHNPSPPPPGATTQQPAPTSPAPTTSSATPAPAAGGATTPVQPPGTPIKPRKASTESPAPKARTGEVVIASNPEGAHIFVDDEDHGITPKTLPLAAGSHTLTLKLDGMRDYTEPIKVKAGGRLPRRIKLEAAAQTAPAPTPAAPSNVGTVHVLTIPSGARVTADNSVAATTTPATFTLSVGHHVVVLSISGKRPIVVEIDVTAGKTNEITKSFDNP
ncbi:MAG: protein kinase domain-containing protein [Terriglobia bacterium]